MQETWVRSLGQEDLLEAETATHCSLLAWDIPWAKQPGRLHPLGSQRVGHNLVTKQQQKPILQLHPSSSQRQWGPWRPTPWTRTRLITVAWKGQSSQFSSVKRCSREKLCKLWPTIPPRSGFHCSSDFNGVSADDALDRLGPTTCWRRSSVFRDLLSPENKIPLNPTAHSIPTWCHCTSAHARQCPAQGRSRCQSHEMRTWAGSSSESRTRPTNPERRQSLQTGSESHVGTKSMPRVSPKWEAPVFTFLHFQNMQEKPPPSNTHINTQSAAHAISRQQGGVATRGSHMRTWVLTSLPVDSLSLQFKFCVAVYTHHTGSL